VIAIPGVPHMKKFVLSLALAALCVAPSYAHAPKHKPKPAAVSPIHAVLQWLGLEKDGTVPVPPPPRPLGGSCTDPNGLPCKPTP
jgi:hypothetical protein